jgi:hypothetical protein
MTPMGIEHGFIPESMDLFSRLGRRQLAGEDSTKIRPLQEIR